MRMRAGGVSCGLSPESLELSSGSAVAAGASHQPTLDSVSPLKNKSGTLAAP